jgi:hypothetical protein
MNRSPLKRQTPLRAKRWGIKPRRPRRLSGPGADPARMGFVAELPCVGVNFRTPNGGRIALLHRCEGRIEVCHEGRTGKGIGTRCPDSETIPMCTWLHRQWTEHRGWFAGWTKETRRAWADARIAETTALYLSHGSRR